MKKLYLHMGFHKTATSSFQATCRQNTTQLKQQGYIYPIFECRGYNPHPIANHSAPIFSCFSHNPSQYIVNIKWKIDDVVAVNTEYLAQLDRYMQQEGDVILSGEDISLLKTNELKQLVSYLETQYKVNVIPIACVRSPYSFHCSAAQERVKGGQVVDFSVLVSQRDRMAQLSEAFGEDLQLISFSEACKHQAGPVGYLLNWLGINIDAIQVVASNEGASNEFVRAQNLLNSKKPLLIKGELNPDHVRLKQHKGQKFLLTKDEYAIIKKSLDDENRFFKKTFGVAFCDTEISLREPFTAKQLMDAYADDFASSQLSISDIMVNKLRDMAISEEGNNLQLAYDLMLLAHRGRPSGPFIKNKLEEYKKQLK